MQPSPLQVGVFVPPSIPPSFEVYLDNVLPHIDGQRIRFIRFGGPADLPASAQVLWDIRSGGGNPPPEFLLARGLPPLVVTAHGFAPMSLPLHEYYGSWRDMWWARGGKRAKRLAWQRVHQGVAHLLVPSEFSKREALKHTGMAADRVTVCPHGVDSELFGQGTTDSPAPYLLHVSNDEPRKNIHRIVDAFGSVRRRVPALELVLKVPAASKDKYAGLPGVRVIAGHLASADLARLYRGALGFVFPSLYEGFGLPILEAMVSGCPVITSNTTACAEVAGSAARLVDARARDSIVQAMLELAESPELRLQLQQAGLARARGYSWQASAACHAGVLLQIAASQRSQRIV